MQFFLITPPLLFAYVMIHPLVGWIISGALAIASVIASAVIVHHNDLASNPISEKNGVDFFKLYYNLPYTRISAYIVGL